jgi:hypothetical protein
MDEDVLVIMLADGLDEFAGREPAAILREVMEGFAFDQPQYPGGEVVQFGEKRKEMVLCISGLRQAAAPDYHARVFLCLLIRCHSRGCAAI